MLTPKLEPFILTENERQSALWMKLKKHYEERLAMLRARNDRPVDERRANLLRGQIAELKYQISLNEPRRTVAPEDELFKD